MYRFNGVFILLLLLTLISCGNGGSSEPEITSIQPDNGPPGTLVTINGKDFGTKPSTIMVTFGDIQAEINRTSNTQLEVTVPDLDPGPVTVNVNAQNTMVSGPSFMVERGTPGISSVEPDSGTVGTEIVIEGMNFSPVLSENVLRFNGASASLISATETELVTEVPTGAIDGPIGLRIRDKSTTGPEFDVITVGAIEITITTTGESQDEDGYIIEVNQNQTAETPSEGNIYFTRLEEGDNSLELTGNTTNCYVAGENPRNISVIAGDTVSTEFEISCSEIQSIAFVSERTGNQEIWITDSNGANQQNLTVNNTPDSEPMWSPNGARLLFTRYEVNDWDIWVMNRDGSAQQQLTNNEYGDWAPVWSPDGDKIAFESNRSGENLLWIMDSDGSNVQQLTTGNGSDFGALWSPDGNRIIFASFRSGNQDIWLVQPGSTTITNLSDAVGLDYPSDWSPDGQQILFNSTRSGNSDIWVMNADGTNPKNLTNSPADDYQPKYSPDGTKILYRSENDIWVMDADGTNQSNLTDHPDIDHYHGWSRSGNQIFFISNRGANDDLWIMNNNGSNPQNLTNSQGSEHSPDWE